MHESVELPPQDLSYKEAAFVREESQSVLRASAAEIMEDPPSASINSESRNSRSEHTPRDRGYPTDAPSSLPVAVDKRHAIEVYSDGSRSADAVKAKSGSSRRLSQRVLRDMSNQYISLQLEPEDQEAGRKISDRTISTVSDASRNDSCYLRTPRSRFDRAASANLVARLQDFTKSGAGML